MSTHSTAGFSNTTQAPTTTWTGREATTDGIILLSGRHAFQDSIECFLIGGIAQTFDGVRFCDASFGRSTQRDFEARWQRVEHYNYLTW